MQWWKLRRSIHSSWLIAILCVGVVVGVVAAGTASGMVFGHIVWLYSGLALLAVSMWRSKHYVIPLIFIAGLMIGAWRGSVVQQQLAPYDNLIGRQVTVRASISEDVDIGPNNNLTMRLVKIEINDHPMNGIIWASSVAGIDIKRGDMVTVTGVISEGFGSFSASMYRARVERVQRPQPGDVARQARDGFADGVRVAVPEPQASLSIGYLVGQRRALPEALSEALRIAGLTHVIVASGYNLTILVRLARRIFAKISKYLALLSASTMIIGFIAVTGMSPSMSRAGLVAGLSLLAWYYGRKFHPLVLLSFAAAVTLLVNPSYGWGDLGWQLSFAAFGGVMIVAPLAQRYFFGQAKPSTVRQILGETISAQLATLPILIMAFGQFSNVAIVANLLVLPFVPIAMLGTFIAGLSGLLLPAIASVLGAPVNWLLQYMIYVATYVSGLPWAQSDLEIGLVAMIGYYVAMIGVCVYMWYQTKFNLRDSNIIE